MYKLLYLLQYNILENILIFPTTKNNERFHSTLQDPVDSLHSRDTAMSNLTASLSSPSPIEWWTCELNTYHGYPDVCGRVFVYALYLIIVNIS